MKTRMLGIGGALVAMAMWGWSPRLLAQVTVTESMVTNGGTITEFAPDSQKLIIRTENDAAPLNYVVTKRTTFVDENGTPVTVEKVTRGIPVTVRYMREGDRMIATQIVLKKSPVVSEERTTTTTTEERKLTHEERERLEKARHEEKERREKEERELKKLERD